MIRFIRKDGFPKIDGVYAVIFKNGKKTVPIYACYASNLYDVDNAYFKKDKFKNVRGFYSLTTNFGCRELNNNNIIAWSEVKQ